jgi:hypothetical protein
MENQWNINSYSTNNFYYKGDVNDLSNLEIWNNGDIDFVKNSEIKLYDDKGNFYKKECIYSYKTEKGDVKALRNHIEFTLIQYNYDFYLIPITERHSLSSGRSKTEHLLSEFGIKGFDKCFYKRAYKELHHYSYGRTKYEVSRPLEVCYAEVYRFNTREFIDFSSKKYLENYNNALKKYPLWERELLYLKETNLNIICDFYGMERTVLEKDKFDRLTYSIKALNKKINNKINN